MFYWRLWFKEFRESIKIRCFLVPPDSSSMTSRVISHMILQTIDYLKQIFQQLQQLQVPFALGLLEWILDLLDHHHHHGLHLRALGGPLGIPVKMIGPLKMMRRTMKHPSKLIIKASFKFQFFFLNFWTSKLCHTAGFKFHTHGETRHFFHGIGLVSLRGLKHLPTVSTSAQLFLFLSIPAAPRNQKFLVHSAQMRQIRGDWMSKKAPIIGLV